MEIKNDIFDVHESNGKGLGAFAANKVMEGTEIVTEKPSVIGPKQTSSFVCVDCFDYIDEQTGKLLISRNFYVFYSTRKYVHTLIKIECPIIQLFNLVQSSLKVLQFANISI